MEDRTTMKKFGIKEAWLLGENGEKIMKLEFSNLKGVVTMKTHTLNELMSKEELVKFNNAPPARSTMMYMETFSGVKFYPTQALPSEFRLLDMCHATSQICRFNGHTKHFWSGAQHLLGVLAYLRWRGASEFVQFLGATHDLHEAYFTDLPTPIKLLFPEYMEAEDRIMATMWHSFFGIRFPTKEEIALLKEADRAMLHAEAIAMDVNKTKWVTEAPEFIYSGFRERVMSGVRDELFNEVSILWTKAGHKYDNQNS
jgi:hypothetical protein